MGLGFHSTINKDMTWRRRVTLWDPFYLFGKRKGWVKSGMATSQQT